MKIYKKIAGHLDAIDLAKRQDLDYMKEYHMEALGKIKLPHTPKILLFGGSEGFYLEYSEAEIIAVIPNLTEGFTLENCPDSRYDELHLALNTLKP